MTTKPPSPVSEFPPDALEKIAYAAVADLPGREPNDNNRLGYNVWAWLKDRKGTLEQAIRSAGFRTELPPEQVVMLVEQRLRERGVSL